MAFPSPQPNQMNQGQGGGFLQGLSNFFFGTPGRQMSTITPQQEQLQQALIPLIMQLLQGNVQGFGPIEEEARQGFKQKTIPTLAERFSSLGGSPGGSSGFAGLLGEAGTNLERSLASQKAQFGQSQLAQLLVPALQSNLAYIPRQQGILEALAPGAGMALGKFATGGF